MEISIFLAKFWGWYLLIFFTILTFNPKRIKQIFEDFRDQKFLIISAFLAIVIGLLNILSHNFWEPDWRFVITAIGWMALFFGLSLLIFPDPSRKALETASIQLVQIIYILFFLIGFYLLNKGYNLLIY